jgi:hypothetical protein
MLDALVIKVRDQGTHLVRFRTWRPAECSGTGDESRAASGWMSFGRRLSSSVQVVEVEDGVED